MRFRMNLQIEFLSTRELETVLAASLRILKGTPFRIQGTPEFMDYLAAFGCRIEGERVWFTGDVIDKTLARIRRRKQEWLDSGGEASLASPGAEVSVYTHGQALLACDLETNALRPATTQDLATWCRVVDAFGDVSRAHPTFIPTDLPTDSSDFLTYATIILNSRAPHVVSLYNARMLPYFIEASEVVYGSLDAVKEKAPFVTKMWVNSPFMITRENVEIAMAARRLLGRPIHPAIMAVAGASTPVTVAGALAQNTAELLGVNAVCLAVDDRLRGCSIAFPVVLDMATGGSRETGPDFVLHRYALEQMGAHLFGGRPCLPAMNAGAQVVSPQALFEKATSAALVIANGGRSLAAGCLGSSDVGSLVQLVLDYEIAGFWRHLLRDVHVDDAHIAEALIAEVIPAGARHMETEHTARFFREAQWLPNLFDFRTAPAWKEGPSDPIERARARAREMARTAENQCPLSAGQRAEIRRLMTAAREEADSAARR